MENNTEQSDHSSTANPELTGRGFATALGTLFATLGSAIGLGNIWKFPYLAGENGGAAFILVYLLSTLLVGLPIMISEIMLGRSARANAIRTMRMLSPSHRQPWWLIGAIGALSAFLIMAFYSGVAGWVFAYIFKSAAGGLLSTEPQVTSSAFAALVGSPWQSLFWQWLVLALVAFILVRGVSRGIEATTRRLIPLLFILLVIVAIRSLTLPGAREGLAFLFSPDFSKLTAAAVLTAMGLAFFKLSIGMGTMITYGSYFPEQQNIPSSTARVMLSDLAASLLAGLAIFPAVFAFGFEPAAGPSLLFITIPAVFASMPFGGVFMLLFFVLAAVAATGAMLSLVEVPVAYLQEQFHLSRPRATILTTLLIALVGATASLSNNAWSGFQVFGFNLFDLYDFVTSNILLPVGGFFIAVFAGWVWGVGKVRDALSNRASLPNAQVVGAFLFVVRYITPLLVLVILLRGLNLLPW
jgi:NSS family neurotransmitter:Na+ symporter